MSDLEYLLKNKYQGCTFFKIKAEGEKATLEFDYYNNESAGTVSGELKDYSQKKFKESEINLLAKFLGEPRFVELLYVTPSMSVKITPFIGDSSYVNKTRQQKEVYDLSNFTQMQNIHLYDFSLEKGMNSCMNSLHSKVSYIDKEKGKEFLDVYEDKFSSEFIKNLYKTSIQNSHESYTLLLLKGLNEKRQIEVFYKNKKTYGENKPIKHIGFQGEASLDSLEKLFRNNTRINYMDAEVIDAY